MEPPTKLARPLPRFERILHLASFAAGLATLAAVGAAAFFVASPLPQGLLDYRKVASVRIVDREGGLLRELLSRSDGRSTPLPPEEIPAHVKAAFVAAEDKGFYGHCGISPSSILRAAWQNVRAGRVVAGGSTLTQQLARNLVRRPRTLWGKVQEALWAMRLEWHLSKEQILAQYLNRVSFGNNAYGIEAASQLYFGRRAKHLSLGQAAALASMPKGPSSYNPYRHPERLEKRREWVLERMAALGFIDFDAARRAASEPMDLEAFEARFRAPHFAEFIAAHLDEWGLAEATLIETTLDPALQLEVEDQIRQELGRLRDRRVSSAAVLAVDNLTGEVLAYQGSADFFDETIEGQNDGVQMLRQPGSALKPFLYAEAFARGFTPATVIADLETHFAGRQGGYSPKNYDRRAHGPVRAREALANSYNVPAVKVAEALGAEQALRVLRRAGFHSLRADSEHYGLGIALGNGEVSLWEAARAYSGLSRGGVLWPLRPIRRAYRADGSEIPLRDELLPRPFADPRAAALVTHILSDNAARARAFGLENALRLPFSTAAKTGTSKGYSDNWTIGYTRERTVAVWAGNFDGTPMVQVSGITGAGPIFKRVMVRAMGKGTPLPLVDESGLERVRICPLSGARASKACPSSMEELFIAGTAPSHDCPMHALVAPSLPEGLAERCRAIATPDGRVVDLGPEYYEWARAEGWSDEPHLASACTERGPASSADEVALLFPNDGDEYLLMADLPLQDQAIPLRVRASARHGPIEVRIDGRVALELEPPFSGRIAATKGEHLLTLHRPGEAKALAKARFRVRSERPIF